MIEEGRHLASLAPNIVVKLLSAQRALLLPISLFLREFCVNMTLIFSAPFRPLLAANAGARYISPFVGRFMTSVRTH